MQLGSTTSATAEVLVRCQTSAATSTRMGPALRISTNNGYIGRLSAAANNLVIGKIVSGTETDLFTTTFTVSTATFYWIRFRAVGSNLYAKAWADGSSEPSSWTLTGTDSSITSAGGYGLTINASSTATTWDFDSFTATDATTVYAFSTRAVIKTQVTDSFKTRTKIKTQITDAFKLRLMILLPSKAFKMRSVISTKITDIFKLRSVVHGQTTKSFKTRSVIKTTSTDIFKLRFRLSITGSKSFKLRSKIKTQNTKSFQLLAVLKDPPILSGGFTIYANGANSSSFDHFRVTQYPDPSLSLSTILPRLGSSIVSWNDILTANTTFGMDISYDGVNWTDVTANNGQNLPILFSQPNPTVIGFNVDESASFTNTNVLGGSTATWTYDTSNDRIIASGGMNATYIYNSISRTDIDFFVDMDYSDLGGLVFRYNGQGSMYYVTVTDTLSNFATRNTVTLYRIGYMSVIKSDTPLGYYRLGETSGTVAYDSSGNGQNATYSNTGVTYGQADALTGDNDTAVLFNGSTGKVTLPTTVNPQSTLTYECWFKISSYPGGSTSIMGNYDSAGSLKGAGFGLNSTGHVTWNLVNGSNAFVSITSSAVTTGVYHHIVGTYDGTASKFYLDGSLVGSSTTTFTPNTEQIQIGSSPFNDYNTGYVDEVAVYNYALTSTQVSNHFSQASNPIGLPLTSAVITYQIGPANNPFTATFVRGTYHRIRVSALINIINIYVDGQLMITYNDTASLGTGQVGMFSNGGTNRYYTLWIQPIGDYVSGSPAGDIVTGTFVYTRQRLSTTQPSENPQIEDITTAAYNPQIGVGSLIPNVQYQSTPVGQNIDDLAKQSNYSWFIDDNKYVNFYGQNLVPSPWILQSSSLDSGYISDIEVNSDLELDVSNDLYRNRQTILGVYTLTTFDETNIGDGSTRTFPMGYEIRTVNFILVNGITQTIGIKGQTGFDFYYADGDPHLVQDTNQTVLSNTDVIEVNYVGYVSVTVVVDNTSAQTIMANIDGSSGIVEAVEDHSGDNPKMLYPAAISLANSLLTRYATLGRTLVFDTSRPGLALGQTLSIFLPEHGIFDGSFTINQLELTLQKGINDTQVWWWKVTASELPKKASWAKIISNGLILKTKTA